MRLSTCRFVLDPSIRKEGFRLKYTTDKRQEVDPAEGQQHH